MSLVEIIKELQTELNRGGAGLVVDGIFGAKTDAALVAASSRSPAPSGSTATTPTPAPRGPAPWRDWFLSRLGWTEFDHDAELSKGWPLVKLPQFHTVIGILHAWCGMSLATALHACGYKIPAGAAGAQNWDGYGESIDWKKNGIPRGAVVRIRHHTGGAHVSTADRDHAPGEQVAQLLGGNQGNGIRVSVFNVSGVANGHDEVAYVGWPVKS